jgi:hypothetical protein
VVAASGIAIVSYDGFLMRSHTIHTPNPISAMGQLF